MKKTERFDDVLSACLDRILKGETVEQCLESYPSHAQELEPLLRTAAMARVASEIQPRAEFKASARYQFQSAVNEMQLKKVQRHWFSNWHWQLRPGLVVALVAVFLIVAAGGGTVAAASNSMPESALYPVKLTAEQVQMALTFSTVGKAELNARFANKRVAEIVYAASRGDTQDVLEVAGRLNSNLENISILIGGESASETLSAAASGNNLNTTTSNGEQPMMASSQPVPSPTVMQTPGLSAPALQHSLGSAVPSALSPQPGAVNVAVNPTFSWPPVDGATGYDFQLADNPEFNNPVESIPNLPANSYVITTKLDSNAIYFWRYRSVNADTGADGDWVQNGFTTGNEYAASTPVMPLPPITLTVPQVAGSNAGNKLTGMEKLTQQIAQSANDNSAHLEEALSKAPPEVRPALEQTISRASAEYNKLIKQLEKAGGGK